jgi:hypothetical protein
MLCCVCLQTRLGPGPRQQGRQVQEVGCPTLGEEAKLERKGRSAAEVCTSEARKIGVPLARARTESSAGLVSLLGAKAHKLLLGTPHALRKQIGHGNGAAMQSVENDRAVSHPSHSRLEDADEARVSHIPTTTATRLDKKDKQLRLLHPSIGLFSSMRLPGGSFRQCDLSVLIERAVFCGPHLEPPGSAC